jgi:peptidoglycan-N-acetylglucosamine deacetylase
VRILREGYKRSPWWLRLWLRDYEFFGPNRTDRVYLTFDDGPTPGVTDEVLRILGAYGAQATFFCIGQRATRHPELIDAIVSSGHTIGNHTDSHLNGWQTNDREYLADIERCQRTLDAMLSPTMQTSRPVFRPPFGRARRSQTVALRSRYRQLMWDITAQDFLSEMSSDAVAENVIQHTRPGSIVLFHDSEEAGSRMLPALPKVLQWIQSKGWQAASL